MTVQLWGFEGVIYFALPMRLFGAFLLILSTSITAYILVRGFRERLSTWRRSAGWRRWLFLTLIVSSPLLAQTFLVQIPVRPGTFIPGVPLEPSPPTFALFGALPWMLAAGMFGVWEATLLGLLAGLARGGWGTQHLMTPCFLAVEAAAVAWLLRRDYEELPGRLARSPAFSSLVGGALFGLCMTLERFSYSGGSVFDGLDFAGAMLGPIMLASLVESGFPGALGESVRWVVPEVWYKPARLVVGPYNRSLAARLVTVFLLLGIASGGVLLYGDWVLAQRSARELIERELVRSASQFGQSVPYFIQTGRMLTQESALELSELIREGELSAGRLQAELRANAFFSDISIFDVDLKLMAKYPAHEGVPWEPPQEVSAALRAAREGVSEEVVVPTDTAGSPSEIIFVTPIEDPQSGEELALLAATSRLTVNPLIKPALTALEASNIAEAYLTDENGLVLLQAGQAEPGVVFDSDVLEAEGVRLDVAPDGSRRLLYAHPVGGYPWSVVVATPYRTVQRQAFEIASRLFGVVVLVGGLLVLAVYAISRRLTQPLRTMSSIARSIARGHLAQPVPSAGRDEIGLLSSSFERMRRSLKARLEELELLLNVSNQVAASFDLETVLPPILEGARGVNGATLVRLVLKGDQGDSLLTEQSLQAGLDPGNWSSLDQQVLALCESRGRFTLENPSRAKAVLDTQSVTEPVEALTALPIRHRESFVGVLWLGHRSPRSISPDDLNLLTILAGQLGVAVANGRLYQRVQQERRRLRAVLDVTPDAVIVFDRQERIVLVNPTAERLLNWSKEDAEGKTVEGWIRNGALRRFLLQKGDDGVRTAEISLDADRVVFATVSEIYTEETEPSGRVCVLWDVSHYKKLDALKTEFVSTVSHDLRAPLTLMRGYATMLNMVGDVNEQQQSYLDKILASLERMGRLIDNLLDLGRIEAGMGLTLGTVHVGEVVGDVVQSYRARAQNKQLSLDLHLQDDLSPIEADGALLEQAVGNLVDNAIKFTPSGGRVEVEIQGTDEHIQVLVKDTGVGIAAMDQARLFEKFYHGREGEGTPEKGLGLGLAIVRSIAEQHGGRVHVESRLGEGSTFTLEVPIRQKGRGPHPSANRPNPPIDLNEES
jgi:PAS domain S-box-containing protein